MTKSTREVLPKAVCAVAAVVVIALIGSAHAETSIGLGNAAGISSSQNNFSGFVNHFDVSYNSSSAMFIDRLDAALSVIDTQATGDFATVVNDQGDIFDQSIKSAETQFINTINQSVSRGESKDQFIASFSSARDSYFNKLNAAKDNFSSSLNQAGSGQEANHFSGEFNSALADYGNQLEGAKNTFADSVNNR